MIQTVDSAYLDYHLRLISVSGAIISLHWYKELLKINNYKAPRDKLICILNSCKVIFGT